MPANIGIFQTLVSLPLFIGMDAEELKSIVAKTKFNFRTVPPGGIIVDEGTRSGMLIMLTHGKACVTMRSADGGFSVDEEGHGPAIIQPECAFGVQQRFSQTWKAVTTCSLISLDKNEILRLTDVSLIFRLNLLNIISTQLQKRQHDPWRSLPRTPEDRVRRFLLVHSLFPAGRKVFHIKMQRLGLELNENPRVISTLLHHLESQGLIEMRRGMIIIPAIERLSR